MTVTRRAHQYGIPVRPAGVHSRRDMLTRADPDMDPDIRAAVDGGLGGWTRLHRFQIAMHFPTLATAADYLHTGPSALSTQFQRLERDIGAPLYHRASTVHPDLTPTERGAALLAALTEPAAQKQLRNKLGDHQLAAPPDRAALQRARAQAGRHRPPSPIQPYPGINVEPLRNTQPLRAILQVLLDTDDELHGLPIADRAGVQYGTAYPLRARLHQAGWTTTRHEPYEDWQHNHTGPSGRGRPRRRYHQLTNDGRRAAEHLLVSKP